MTQSLSSEQDKTRQETRVSRWSENDRCCCVVQNSHYNPLIEVLHQSIPIQLYNKKKLTQIRWLPPTLFISRDVFVNLPKEVLISRNLTLCYEKTFMQQDTCTKQPFFVKLKKTMFTLVNLSYLICVAYFYCVLVRLRLYCVRIFDWLGVAVRSQNNFPLYCFFVAWIIKES